MWRLREPATLYLLSRVAFGVGSGLAALIILGIVLVVLQANPENAIASALTSIAEALAAPFDGIFTLRDRRGETAVNWGIGAAVYFVLGVVVADMLGRRMERADRRR